MTSTADSAEPDGFVPGAASVTSVADQTLHLLVRWKVSTEPNTVTYHREVAEEHGSVWWRQLGGNAGPSENNFARLQMQLESGIPTYVFLRRQGEVWRTTLRQIERGDFEPDSELVPTYYAPNNAQLWLRLADFEVLPGDWPEQHLRFAQGKRKGDPVEFVGQNALLFVTIAPSGEEPEHHDTGALDAAAAELIEEILELQPKYSLYATEEMKLRQERVRSLGDVVRSWVSQINDARAPSEPVLDVETGGQVGNFAAVPWVRVYSPAHSPKATQGIYLVILFTCDGNRAFLSLNQGTSVFKGNKWRPVSDAADLGEVAKEKRLELTHDDAFDSALDLAIGATQTKSKDTLDRLKAYEIANIVTATYHAGTIDGAQVHADFEKLVNELKILYSAPGSKPLAEFGADLVQALVEKEGLLFDPSIVPTVVAALESGKHVILTGPPGTAKTTLAGLVADAATLAGRCTGYRLTTATSDWTTFETIGGLRPTKLGDGLEFARGQFLGAIENREWLVVDELNRSNFDRAFGQLFTVLAGQGVELPYEDPDSGLPILIAPEGAGSMAVDRHLIEVPASWRLIATMNVFDKSLLFEMSFALMRRFCFIEVGAPDDEAYTALMSEAVHDQLHADAVLKVIRPLLRVRRLKEIGPSLYIDMARFARERLRIGDPGTSALRFQLLYSYLLPQFEGTSDADGRKLFALLKQSLDPPEIAKLRITLRDVLGIEIPMMVGDIGADPDDPDDEVGGGDPDLDPDAATGLSDAPDDV